MLFIRREKLLLPKSQIRHGQSGQSASDLNPGRLKTDRVCRDNLMQFAQLRQNLKEEKQMLFVVAELHMLDNAAWQ